MKSCFLLFARLLFAGILMFVLVPSKTKFIDSAQSLVGTLGVATGITCVSSETLGVRDESISVENWVTGVGLSWPQ